MFLSARQFDRRRGDILLSDHCLLLITFVMRKVWIWTNRGCLVFSGNLRVTRLGLGLGVALAVRGWARVNLLCLGLCKHGIGDPWFVYRQSMDWIVQNLLRAKDIHRKLSSN